MTGNHLTDDGFRPGSDDALGFGFGPEADDALRSILRARADLVTITAPPIAAVRRRALRRRKRRGVIQGMAGLAAACAVISGIVAWSPGRETGDAAARLDGAAAVASSSPSNTVPWNLSRPIPASSFLQAPDLGPGWKGPLGNPDVRTALTLDADQCETAGVYQAQVPVTPAENRYFEQSSGPGGRTNEASEAIYIFASGTGAAVMRRARIALATGCGVPQYVKILAFPSTAADEAIVFTVGGDSRNLLVRNGDQVASAFVGIVPPGQDGSASMDALAKRMATRLTAD